MEKERRKEAKKSGGLKNVHEGDVGRAVFVYSVLILWASCSNLHAGVHA